MGLFCIFIYGIILIIQPQSFVPLLLNVPVAFIIIPLTLCIGWAETRRQNREIGLTQHKLMLVFLMFVFLSNVLNGNVTTGTEQLSLYLKRIAVYFMIVLTVNSEARLTKTLRWIILLAALLAVEGIYHDSTGIGWAGQPLAEGRIRWVGDWDGSNGFCLLFILAATFSLEFVTGLSGSGLSRLFSFSALMVLLYGIVLTNSRGGWLALCLVLMLFFAERYKRYVLRFLVSSAVAISLMLALAPSRMSQVDSKEESARERLWTWEQGLGLLRENPLYGIGKGRFKMSTELGLLAHNNYMQIASEVGWIGYFVWLSIPYLCLKGCFLVHRQAIEEQKTALISLSRAMFLAIIGFSAVTFFITMELDILYVLWGLCSVVIIEGRRQWPELSRYLVMTKKDLFVVVCGGVGIIGAIYALAILELF